MRSHPAANVEPYPLVLEPVVLEKVWGGRRLERYGKRLPTPGARYGESWELADMGATSASGAGGDAVRSVIANGPLKGRTVADAVALWGDALVERRLLTAGGAYPLLVKLLDAGENLSVQVHPSPAYAAANPGAHLKAECWYVLEAEPGAVIYAGMRAGVTHADLAAAARRGDGSIVGLMRAVPALPGECHDVPSGTVHALGAGVLVAEVQTPSDTTFRLYDWGRAGRELHVGAALECAAGAGGGLAEPPAPVRLAPGGAALETGSFRVWREEVTRTGSSAARLAGAAVMVVEGEGELVADPADGRGGPARLGRGTTVLVPRGVGSAWMLRAGPGGPVGVLVARPGR